MLALGHKGIFMNLIFLSFFRTVRGQTHKEGKPCRLVLCEGRLSGNISRGMLWRRVIKLRERCLCQAETSGHLITDKWGLVLASARINPFCKHSYPNLLNMSFHNFTKMQMWFPPCCLLREIDLGAGGGVGGGGLAAWRNASRNLRVTE